MTSPISLLAMLGGSTADPATTADAEDPALFAAALVSALQHLQPPVKLTVPVTQVVVEGEVESDGADGDEVAENTGTPETLGQLLDPANEGDGATGAEEPAAAPAGEPDAETPGTTLDVVSDEPARPTTAGTRAATASDEKPAKATSARPTPAPEAAVAEAAVAPPLRKARLEAEPVLEAESPIGAARASEATAKDQPAEGNASPSAAKVRGKTRTASKGELLVGDWSPPPPAFTGWKAPVEPRKEQPSKCAGNDEDATTEVQPTQSAPVQLPAPSQVLVPPVSLVPTPVVSQPVTTEAEVKPAPVPAAPVVETAELDTPTESVRQAQVANSRLAAQLAELVGDRNVTDFRVQLGKGKRPPDSTAAPGVKVSGESPIPPTAEPVARLPLVSKGETPDQPVVVAPRPTRTDPPVPAERQTVTPNRLMDLTDGPAIAEPLRAARAAAGPIVPALRKEIPAPSQSEKKSEPLLPEKVRPRDDSPSEPPAAASGANQGQSESLTSRSEPDATRGTREARNLPQEDSGNDRPAGSADRVTVQVSDSEGRQTRIRVSVLGDQVRAVIIPPDSESARQLEQRMDDLQTALARQGFAGSKVSVQQAGENAVERNGASLAGMASGNENKAASPGKDQPAGDQRQGRGQREQQHPGDGHRHPNGRSRDQGAEHRRRFTDV